MTGVQTCALPIYLCLSEKKGVTLNTEQKEVGTEMKENKSSVDVSVVQTGGGLSFRETALGDV